MSCFESNLFFNPYYPNFEFFHKNLRFGVFLSADNYFTLKNSKKYVLMVPGPKYCVSLKCQFKLTLGTLG